MVNRSISCLHCHFRSIQASSFPLHSVLSASSVSHSTSGSSSVTVYFNFSSFYFSSFFGHSFGIPLVRSGFLRPPADTAQSRRRRGNHSVWMQSSWPPTPPLKQTCRAMLDPVVAERGERGEQR